MTSVLKILLLEDNSTDAELVNYELKKANLDYLLKISDNKESFTKELSQFKPDIVLSDYNLPNFNGLEALEIVKITCVETPFLLVTGHLDEETAVKSLKSGAWDYILKDKLVRLVPAINSAMKLKEEIGEKNQALEDLKKSEAKYQDLYDHAPDMFLSIDPKTAIVTNCNQTLLNEMGYTREEFVGKEIYNFYTHGSIQYAKEILFPYFNKTKFLKGAELEVIKKDGSIIDVSLTNSAVCDENGHIIHSRSIWRDVTEKKKTEKTLKKSEEKYRAMLEANQDIVIIKSPDNTITYMNPAAKLKSKKRNIIDNCHQALFGLDMPCKDCKVANNFQKLTYHREITDPFDSAIYLASYFPIKNIDGSDSTMCIYKDITNLRNIENERSRLLNVLEATQNEIYIVDQSNNQIKYVNESAVHNTGYSKDELLKLSAFDLLFDYSKHTLNEITNSIDRKEYGKIVFEANIKRKDTSHYPVEIHLQIIEQNKDKLLLAIVIDITERQKKDELIIKLSKGIEQSPVSVVITDLEGKIEFINPKFTESTGYSFEEVRGKNPSILKSGHTNLNEYKELWETIKNGGIWQSELLNKKKNTELYWEDAIIGPIKDKNNQITHFIALKLDISRRKKIEEELKEEKLLLSKRVDERTSDLSQLNAELYKAVRMKDEFLANMSHELRTPLNAILGMSEVLQEEVYGPINDAQLKSLKTIEDSGRHLLDLINDILDIAKVSAGKVELEIFQVSILSICQLSLNFIKQAALKKNIKYTLQVETLTEHLMADERRLKQILINLLSNAVKFTPAGGSIGIIVREDKLAESISFTVWDTGIGIRPESLTKLFKPFIQIDSSLSREYAGTGLGLTLVKNLTELHGGCVTVESTPAQGSSFTISLPLTTFTIFDEDLKKRNLMQSTHDNSISDVKKAVIAKEPAGDKALVLIAEDNENNIYMLIDYLKNLNYRILVARNGNEAVSLAQEKCPDIILMDIQMPVLDGIEATKIIRKNDNPKIAKVPIIALTALAMPEDMQKCFDAGIDEYIKKPLSLKNLVIKIEEILSINKNK